MKMFKFVVLLSLIALFVTDLRAQNNRLPDESLIYVTATAWSHDGSKIAAVGIQSPGVQGYLHILDSATGETIYALNPRPGGFASVAWSPDDRFVAAGGYDQAIWIFDVAAQSNVAALRGHQATISAVDWNSDGTRLVSGGNWDELVILWDMTTYRQIRVVETSDVWSVEYSPDFEQIAVGGGGGLRIFPSDLEVGVGREQNPYRYFTTLSIGALAWSHRGDRIAFGTQVFPSVINPNARAYAQIYLLDSRNGDPLRQIPTEDETLYSIVWSPDDRLLATYSIGGTVSIWDAQTGEPLESFPATDGYPADISFSPYGGRLAYGGTLPAGAATAPTALQRNAQGVSLAGGAVHIVVPAPSRARLQAIADLCGATPAIERAVNADLTAADLATLSAAVEALPTADIPPACAADLIAVAEALGSQP